MSAASVIGQAVTAIPSPEHACALLDKAVGDATVVLIGESTHGTHDFYSLRAALTRTLVTRHGFGLVAAEADWPDAYRVNRWVRGERHHGGDDDVDAALGAFTRFPRWMWRNTDVAAFLVWLRTYNGSRPADRRVGFYGLDLYSLHASMDAVLAYLDDVDPDAARRARDRYGCFGLAGDDPQGYGYATTLGVSPSCEDAVVAQLSELRQRAADYASRDGRVAADDYFMAEQNARLVKNAEQYYRAMFGGRVESWNLRDTHMHETLEALRAHGGAAGRPVKVVVWAHNSHVGDARATSMHDRGELTLGQLVREQHGDEALLIGFTTHSGTVTAADDWGAAARTFDVRPSRDDSHEFLLHQTATPRVWCDMRQAADGSLLRTDRLTRAIGVVYRPQTERLSHYYRARLAGQFDVVAHMDTTTALRPLDQHSAVAAGVPETFPSGQ